MSTDLNRNSIEIMHADDEELLLQQEVKATSMVEVVPRILDVVCKITGLRFAAVARVTDSRWIACNIQDNLNFGMNPGDELKIAETFCTSVHHSDEPVIIDNAPIDPVYCKNPIPVQYGFKSYISVPIKLPNGEFFGTLCALDSEPAKIRNPEIQEMFTLFTELIGLHVYAALRLEKTEESLIKEKQNAELREQFIAVLGHDLKNPLSAIQGSANIISETETSPKSLSLLKVITDSCQRMNSLIEDISDFARGRLGDGLIINCTYEHKLVEAIDHAIEEIRVSNPSYDINVSHNIQCNVWCDQQRILQVVSNLLANAVSYGDNQRPITIETKTTQDQFIVKIINTGKKIPENRIPFLFNPFCRDDKSRNGLGLGLYISSEIAKAHNGTLEATSNDEQTCFCFSIPLRGKS